jgi:hypothetical protein
MEKIIGLLALCVMVSGCVGRGLLTDEDFGNATLSPIGTVTPLASTLWLHLDASERVTYDAGTGNVSGWEDLSRGVQCATGSNYPIRQAAALNGKPVINFYDAGVPNTERSLDCGTLDATPFHHNHTVVYVTQNPQEVHTTQVVFGNAAHDLMFFFLRISGSIYQVRSGRVALMLSDTVNPISDTNFHLISNRFDINQPVVAGTSSSSTLRRAHLRIDGTQQPATTNASPGDGIYVPSTSSFYIGGTGSSYYFTGKLAELRVYDEVLSDADLQALECSLATKWGLTVSGC